MSFEGKLSGCFWHFRRWGKNFLPQRNFQVCLNDDSVYCFGGNGNCGVLRRVRCKRFHIGAQCFCCDSDQRVCTCKITDLADNGGVGSIECLGVSRRSPELDARSLWNARSSLADVVKDPINRQSHPHSRLRSDRASESQRLHRGGSGDNRPGTSSGLPDLTSRPVISSASNADRLIDR
jgi:hypothetical protein